MIKRFFVIPREIVGYFLKKAIMRILRRDTTVYFLKRNMVQFLRNFCIGVSVEDGQCIVSEELLLCVSLAGYCVCPEGPQK